MCISIRCWHCVSKILHFVIPLQCVDCIVVKRYRFTAVWVFLKHSWVMEKLLNHYVDANHSLFHRSYRNGGRSSCSLTCGNSNANSAIILVQRPCIWETHPEAFRREGLHLQPVWLFYFNTMSNVKSHVNTFREEAFQSLPARGKEMSVSWDLDLYYKLPQIRPECCLFAPKCSNAVY